MKTPPRIRFLHLSDIHVTGDADYQQNVVFRGLLKALSQHKWPWHPINAVLITGDLVMAKPLERTGEKEQKYKVVSRFLDSLLEVLNLTRHHLFVVPGNHDVDRERAEWLVATLEDESAAFKYFSCASLPHAAKLATFSRWFNDYFNGIREWNHRTTCQAPTKLTLEGQSVTVFALSSALFCHGDQDHGRLWIGRRCLDAALDQVDAPRSNLTLALVHHPLDWLHVDERSIIGKKLTTHAHVVLSGHLHETTAGVTFDGSTHTLHLRAGACYQTLRWPNCANVLEFTPQDGMSRVIPLRYQDRPNEIWTVDNAIFANSPDGTQTFALEATVHAPLSLIPDETKGLEVTWADIPLKVPRFTLQRYVEPDKFVGRASELDTALRLIDANESLLVIGASRSGKTSFWYKLRDELARRPDRRLHVRVNLQFSGEKTVSHFLARTLLALSGGIARGAFGASYSHLEIKKSDLPEQLRKDVLFSQLYDVVQLVKARTHRRGESPHLPLNPADFEGFSSDLLEIAKSRGQSQCMLFFDEANYLPESFSIELLTNIYECLSTRNVACLYAADPRMPQSFDRLLQTFHHQVTLGAFSTIEEMRQLLVIYYRDVANADVELPMSNDSVELLWDLSKHRPYQIQWIAWKSFTRAQQRHGHKVEPDDIRSAFEFLKTRQPEFFS